MSQMSAPKGRDLAHEPDAPDEPDLSWLRALAPEPDEPDPFLAPRSGS